MRRRGRRSHRVEFPLVLAKSARHDLLRPVEVAGKLG
jgi:hypothetical protein